MSSNRENETYRVADSAKPQVSTLPPEEAAISVKLAAQMDARTLERTQRGAKRIFLRFTVLAVGLNALLGVLLMAFDVADSFITTRERIRDSAEMIAEICRGLQRQHPKWQPDVTLAEVSRITGAPLALVDTQGRVAFSTSKKLKKLFSSIFGSHPKTGIKWQIDARLGAFSGAWMLTPFSSQHSLLVVIRHHPKDEGLLEYMTVGAGILGLGIAVSFFVILIAARWVLHQPLQRLVAYLTGALALDVERRREAEELAIQARVEAERHLAFRENLINASDSVGIIATDRNGQLQIFNRAAEQILGYNAAEVVNSATLSWLEKRASRPPEHELPLRNLMKAGSGEQFWVDKQGHEHLIALSRSTIVGSDGQHAGELLWFIDVTQHRRLEAELYLNELQLVQSAKMASLGEMATAIAHELNQPLNNIGLLTSRILRRLPRESQDTATFCKERLNSIQGQVERASRIIDQLRTFGRVSERALQAVELSMPIKHVTDMLGEQLRLHNVDVVVNVPANIPAVVADPGQLEQVLVNLLVNARDVLIDRDEAIGPPGARIMIEAEAHTTDDTVYLRVADNGPGMPQNVRQRVFQPFFTTKEPGKGTGLGLSVSYSLIQGFGGTITVKSEPGQGAIFEIVLKQAQSHGQKDEDSVG